MNFEHSIPGLGSGIKFVIDSCEDPPEITQKANPSRNASVVEPIHPEMSGPLLFKAYAQKGPKNIASPSQYHKIVWRIDSKGKAVKKNIGDALKNSTISSDCFHAPRHGLYQVLAWANWRADRELEPNKIEKISISADIYISINHVMPPTQIGRGHGGSMYDLQKGDTIELFVKNKQSQAIQLDSENTFINIGAT